MIEKLNLEEVDNPGEATLKAFSILNQLVDAVNELHEEAENNARIRANHEKLIDTLVAENNIHEQQIDELQIKIEPEKCETPAKNVQDEIDKAKREGRVIFPNPADIATALTKSLRMDKEFAEDECARLQNKLERTRKALEIIKKEMSKETMPDFAVISDALKGVGDE